MEPKARDVQNCFGRVNAARDPGIETDCIRRGKFNMRSYGFDEDRPPSMMDFDRTRIDWAVSSGLTDYPFAISEMEASVARIRHAGDREWVWLLEHPPLYTAGTSAQPADLKDPRSLPVFQTGRGGQFTYHGPGQRIAYVMLDVQRRFGSDVRAFVAALERWIIEALAMHGIEGGIRPGRVGVWVGDGPSEKKIAAIGIRVRAGVSYHGVSLNVAPDLGHYAGIVPCGIADRGVTSLADLGLPAMTKDVDSSLRTTFEIVFGPTSDVSAPKSGAAGSFPAASNRE